MTTELHDAYSETAFWQKLRARALRAGRHLVRQALLLYYTARHPGTPAWARTAIYGALGYFILPLDAVPDVIPVAGYSDDLSLLVSVLAAVSLYANKAVRAQAEARLQQWFGGTEPVDASAD